MRQAVGTPSMAVAFFVCVSSLLSGASVIHNIFKPDLTIPSLDSVGKETDNNISTREQQNQGTQ